MRWILTSTRRFTAMALLAWWVGSAVASPLIACCDDAQPCCEMSASAQGCASCAATPSTVSGLSDQSLVAASPRHAWAEPERLGSDPGRPWKPPD